MEIKEMKTHASLDDSGRSVLVLKGLQRSIREKEIQVLEEEKSLESISRKRGRVGRFQSKYH